MGRRTALCLAAAVLAAAGAAQAQVAAAPEFPQSLETSSLRTWLQRATDIAPGQVIALSSAALSAIGSVRREASPDRYSLTLRAEALDPSLYERQGILSWSSEVEIDCAGHRVRQADTHAFAKRNLRDEIRVMRSAEPEWREPPPNTHLDAAWRATCDPAFVRPLAPATREAAADAPPRPGRKPRPAAGASSPPAPASAASPAVAAASPARPEAQAQHSHRARHEQAATASAPTSNPKAAPAGRANVEVQVGASDAQPLAQRELDSVMRRLPKDGPPVRGQVVAAKAGGKTVYREIIDGFASKHEANAFCAALKGQKIRCFVRTRAH
jgi:hypothetical protein